MRELILYIQLSDWVELSQIIHIFQYRASDAFERVVTTERRVLDLRDPYILAPKTYRGQFI